MFLLYIVRHNDTILNVYILASVHHALNLGTDALMGTEVIKSNVNSVYIIGENESGDL